MSTLTGNDVMGLMEAYQAVYAPQELDEVEFWVNSLLEEGYDLSEYTWEEMYDTYLVNEFNTIVDGLIEEGYDLSEYTEEELFDALISEKVKALAAVKNAGAYLGGKFKDVWNQIPKKPQTQLGLPKGGPSSRLPGRTLAPAGGTSVKPALPAAKGTSAAPSKSGPLAVVPKSSSSLTVVPKSKSSSMTAPVGSTSNPIRTNSNVPGGPGPGARQWHGREADATPPGHPGGCCRELGFGLHGQ